MDAQQRRALNREIAELAGWRYIDAIAHLEYVSDLNATLALVSLEFGQQIIFEDMASLHCVRCTIVFQRLIVAGLANAEGVPIEVARAEACALAVRDYLRAKKEATHVR